MRFLIIILIFILASGCSAQSDLAEAQKEVENFHASLDATNFQSIYDNLYDETKNSIPRDQFIKSLAKLQQSFGKYRGCTLINTNITTYVVGAERVTLLYSTQYTLASMREEFVFEKNKINHFLLVSYKYEGWESEKSDR